MLRTGNDTERAKAVMMLGSIPLGACPDYSVRIDEEDIIWPKWTSWTLLQSDQKTGYLPASSVAKLSHWFLGVDLSAEDVAKFMNLIVFKYWIPHHQKDSEVHLHHANVVFASLVAEISPSPSNASLGGLAFLWTGSVRSSLQKPEFKQLQQQMQPRAYLGWLSLLIAETAKRRAAHHHDFFLIKELLDKTMQGWDPADVRICSQLIDSKFSYVDYWKSKILGR